MAHRIVFRPAARSDLKSIYNYIARQAGHERAWAYVSRVEMACQALADFPERGTIRDELHPGVRIVGVERRTSIAFRVENGDVRILRVLYGGRDFPDDWSGIE